MNPHFARRAVHGRPELLFLVFLACLPACAAFSELREADAHARSTGAKTIVLTEKLSLYSPYEPYQAQEWLALVEGQRAEIFALFEVDNDSPIVVQLHPNEGLGVDVSIEGNNIRLNRLLMSPHGGFSGKAGGNVVVIEVAAPKLHTRPDGGGHMFLLGPSMFRDTIRHELTHVATNLAGVRGGDWLREGIAHAVEWIPIRDGQFVLDPVPENLRLAASLCREQRSLDAVLTWKQSFPPKDEDTTMRAIAATLVTFLIEKERAANVHEAFLRVAALKPARIRTVQAEWAAWLDGLAAAGG